MIDIERYLTEVRIICTGREEGRDGMMNKCSGCTTRNAIYLRFASSISSFKAKLGMRFL